MPEFFTTMAERLCVWTTACHEEFDRPPCGLIFISFVKAIR
jgi:hypothetical protein